MSHEGEDMKKKLITHNIKIKLKTRKGIYTNTIWERIAKLMKKDPLFQEENFESILIMGENSLDK